MTQDAIKVSAAALEAEIARLFSALGLAPAAARIVAEDLVEADRSGIGSHGAMLMPLYADRLRAGSVSTLSEGEIVSDRDGAVVLDAKNAVGQLTARQAVTLAVARAKAHGFGAVAVRNGFHLGTTGLSARRIAAEGCIGIVMSSTRPLMPAPGAAEALVGNNPIAIAMPGADGEPAAIDMAMSATAMGKIRLADAAGKPIPADWATDAEGRPTTDAAAAIKGMMLPAAGAKGFGLAFMVDLFCGGLAGGAVGDDVTPLYGNPAVPYACGHFFLAIDVGRFQPPNAFAATVSRRTKRVRTAKRAAGVDTLYAPGDRLRRTRAANGDICTLSASTYVSLQKVAASLGLSSALMPIDGTRS